MSCILVPFMKEIVGYLVFQTEILDGFTLWHCFRLVADEQPFKITAAVHTFNIFVTAAKVIFFILWSNTSKLDAYGTTENAVRIQISVAIITYCLVAIVQHDMQLKRSTYEVLQILSISLTDKTNLRELFDKTDFNDVKELDYPLFEGLFD